MAVERQWRAGERYVWREPLDHQHFTMAEADVVSMAAQEIATCLLHRYRHRFERMWCTIEARRL